MDGGDASMRSRSNIKTNNANAFNPNINNPFLVTTYSPPSLANYARSQAVSEVSTIISGIVGQLDTLIDFNTFTFGISTIKPIGDITDPSQTVTFDVSTLMINAGNSVNFNTPLTTMPQQLNVSTCIAN